MYIEVWGDNRLLGTLYLDDSEDSATFDGISDWLLANPSVSITIWF